MDHIIGISQGKRVVHKCDTESCNTCSLSNLNQPDLALKFLKDWSPLLATKPFHSGDQDRGSSFLCQINTLLHFHNGMFLSPFSNWLSLPEDLHNIDTIAPILTMSFHHKMKKTCLYLEDETNASSSSSIFYDFYPATKRLSLKKWKDHEWGSRKTWSFHNPGDNDFNSSSSISMPTTDQQCLNLITGIVTILTAIVKTTHCLTTNEQSSTTGEVISSHLSRCNHHRCFICNAHSHPLGVNFCPEVKKLCGQGLTKYCSQNPHTVKW